MYKVLAWRIPWIEEPGGLRSVGSLRVRHDWAQHRTKRQNAGDTEKGAMFQEKASRWRKGLIGSGRMARSSPGRLKRRKRILDLEVSVFSVVELLIGVQLFATPWTIARQAPLTFTISRNLLKFMFTELVLLSNHLVRCCPLFLLPLIFPSIRAFSSELVLGLRWPKYWSFSCDFSPRNHSYLVWTTPPCGSPLALPSQLSSLCPG